MNYIKRDGTFVEELTVPETLVERIPRWEPRYSAIQDIRDMNEAFFGFGRDHQGAGMRRVASIPEALLGRLLDIKPDFLLDKPSFYQWLDTEQGKKYATIRRRGREK